MTSAEAPDREEAMLKIPTLSDATWSSESYLYEVLPKLRNSEARTGMSSNERYAHEVVCRLVDYFAVFQAQ